MVTMSSLKADFTVSSPTHPRLDAGDVAVGVVHQDDTQVLVLPEPLAQEIGPWGANKISCDFFSSQYIDVILI